MKKLFCLFKCLPAIFCASAQSLQHAHIPLFAGNVAYSADFTGPFSFLSNTASLATCKRPSVGIYAENKYGIKELKNFTAAFITPVNPGNGIGIVLSYAGTAEFNKSQAGIAYGKNLGNINIGLRFNYTMVRIAGYGSAGIFTCELGSTWKISEKFHSGIQITNPRGGAFGENGTEKLPAVYTIGAGYECSDQLLLSAAIIKEENKAVDVQAGIQYIISRSLYAALGMNSSSSSPAVMFGWQWKDIRLFISGSFHARLGAATGIGIIFFGKKKAEGP